MPLITTGALTWRRTTPVDPADFSAAEKLAVPLDGIFSIAQAGIVRSLPRRLGFGSGTLSASLDPQTGMLKSISTDAAGAGIEPLAFASSYLSQLPKDPALADLQHKQTVLDLQQKICASEKTLHPTEPARDGCPP